MQGVLKKVQGCNSKEWMEFKGIGWNWRSFDESLTNSKEFKEIQNNLEKYKGIPGDCR